MCTKIFEMQQKDCFKDFSNIQFLLFYIKVECNGTVRQFFTFSKYTAKNDFLSIVVLYSLQKKKKILNQDEFS